jgi:hypothetical protein
MPGRNLSPGLWDIQYFTGGVNDEVLQAVKRAVERIILSVLVQGNPNATQAERVNLITDRIDAADLYSSGVCTCRLTATSLILSSFLNDDAAPERSLIFEHSCDHQLGLCCLAVGEERSFLVEILVEYTEVNYIPQRLLQPLYFRPRDN